MSAVKLVILCDAYSAQVRENISGSYAVTNEEGQPLTRSNFFTLDEAAQAALGIVLKVGEEADEAVVAEALVEVLI